MEHNYPKAKVIIEGIEYSWTGYYGCQLESIEWFAPPIGSTRILNLFLKSEYTCTIKVFNTERKGFKQRITWAIPHKISIVEHKKNIEELYCNLQKLI